jgi:hypothetical protein
MAGSTLLAVLLLFLYVKIPVIFVSYEDGDFFITDDAFEIEWIHSVEKEPWMETYQKKQDHLYLVKTRFKTFGAGTPSDGEIIPTSDGFVHMKINRRVEVIHLAVSKNIKTTLYTEEDEIPLYEMVDDYETVTIQIKKLSLWQLLRGEKR